MSSMIRRNESGSIDPLLIPLVLAVLILIGVGVFATWAYSGRQDYKNNVDVKVATAVAANTKQVQTKDAGDYAEAAKNPLKTYVGPSAYGSVTVQYPKTWSAYVADTSGSSPFINGYFQPNIVPDITNQSSSFALRIQVVQDSYSTVMQTFQSQQQDQATVTVQPYALPKLPKNVGSKVVGAIQQNKQGEMVVLPIRDKTLEIWTESDSFKADFENIILANLSFSP